MAPYQSSDLLNCMYLLVTHWLAAAGQFHRNKLLLVVLFEGGSKAVNDIGVGVEGQRLDI